LYEINTLIRSPLIFFIKAWGDRFYIFECKLRAI